MDEIHRKQRLYQNRGIATEVLDEANLHAAEPQLRPGLPGGLLVPGDSVVYPPPIAAAMLETVRQRDGIIQLGEAVVAMTGHQVRFVDGTVLECDYAVNAAGPDAALLSPDFTILPRKGHLVITDRYPGFVTHQLVELGYLKSAHRSSGSSVAFNVQPRPTGQVLIGSSRQYGDDSREIKYDVLSRMLRRAAEYMPAIANLSAIRAWTGFRAATPDKSPADRPASRGCSPAFGGRP